MRTFVKTFVAAGVVLGSAAFIPGVPQGSAWAGDATHSQNKGGQKDIIDTAVSAGKFNTLAAAIKAAGLADALKGPGPFTVFAPTDEAFAKLPKGTVEDLLKPENKEKLASILKYHVVSAKATSADVSSMTSAPTLQGKELRLASRDGKVMVNDAQVTKADIVCSNGVIHVIDSVLLP